MIGARIEIAGTLRVVSPLHIGTGGGREVARGDGTAQIGAIARDHLGKPYLPGSSIKGVLRRLWEDDDGIFGKKEIREAKDAVSGAVIFRNAWMLGATAECTFVAAHVAIEGATGVAKSGLLFQDDMVTPGTEFGLRLAVMNGHKDVLATVRALLARMTVPAGVAFGGGTRLGDGRLRLEPTITLTYHPEGRKETIKLTVQPTDEPRWRLRLHSDVPFLIHDPDRSEAGGEGRKNVLRGLPDFDGKGERLTGSSLMGALRAAFAVHAARVDPAEAAVLTDTLFGTARGRGWLAVRAIRADAAGALKSTTSVKIDRFSGATIDNALFATEGHVGTSFVVDLVTQDRKGIPANEVEAADAAFRAFLAELSDDIWGGLMLGHAAGRGYGWFTVKEVK